MSKRRIGQRATGSIDGGAVGQSTTTSTAPDATGATDTEKPPSRDSASLPEPPRPRELADKVVVPTAGLPAAPGVYAMHGRFARWDGRVLTLSPEKPADQPVMAGRWDSLVLDDGTGVFVVAVGVTPTAEHDHAQPPRNAEPTGGDL